MTGSDISLSRARFLETTNAFDPITAACRAMPIELNHSSMFQPKGKDAIQKLADDLVGEAGRDDNWPVQDWLLHALTAGDQVVAVRSEAGEAIGFASFSRYLTVSHDGKQDCVELQLEMVSVYIKPSFRGQGYAKLLSGAIANHLDAILYMVAGLKLDPVVFAGITDFKCSLWGNLQSEGGAAFFRSVDERLGKAVSAIQGRTGNWFSKATLTTSFEDNRPAAAPYP